jgi:beta-lactamase family protein/ANTAR domain-containing protein
MTGDQVVSGATGTWNLDAVPATEDVVLRIASLAKPVVAALALHLVEDGVLDLDAPVERWLPELADRRGLRRLDGCVDDVVTADQAFLVLVRASQDTNRKLHEVAQHRTDTGVLAEGQRGGSQCSAVAVGRHQPRAGCPWSRPQGQLGNLSPPSPDRGAVANGDAEVATLVTCVLGRAGSLVDQGALPGAQQVLRSGGQQVVSSGVHRGGVRRPR